MVKSPPANARDAGSIPRLERSSGGGHGIHSSVLAWRIPWTDEPDGLLCLGSQRTGHDSGTKHAHTVLISGAQQSDSVTHIFILSQMLFPYRLLPNIE